MQQALFPLPVLSHPEAFCDQDAHRQTILSLLLYHALYKIQLYLQLFPLILFPFEKTPDLYFNKITPFKQEQRVAGGSLLSLLCRKKSEIYPIR